MFAYLSKKIAMPNNTRVESVAWSPDQGFLGVGGEKGLLKILKFEDKKDAKSGNVNLSTNQTLGQHKGTVQIVMWNDAYKKLTTSDDEGLIVVWMNQQDYWFEEMINNRMKSFVSGMRWSPDGTRICIIYDDGAVIVGSVSGDRLWGKDLKHRLALVEWSPDGKYLLFGTPEGEVRVYDDQGNPLYHVKILCFTKQETNSIYTPNFKLAAVQWYEASKMYTDETPPGLCIAYENGRIQLMKNEKDDTPIVFDAGIKILSLKWNPSGNTFAVCGYMTEGDSTQPRGIVQFYNNQGYHLRSLTIQNSEKITSLSWEGTGLRISLATGSAVYYANIKPDYKWGYMENTIVFAYQKADRIDYCIIFWDFRLGNKNLKYVKNLWAVKTCGEYCIVISKDDSKGEDSQQWILELCNTIGTALDRKTINIEPSFVYMTKTHVFICSSDHVYVWQYRNQASRLTSFESVGTGRRFGRETAFFIDEAPNFNNIYDREKYDSSKECNDPICSIAANETLLIIARASGNLFKYGLPHMSLEAKMFLKYRPNLMEINCASTRIAIVDMNGTLSFFEMDSHGGGSVLDLERNEVWQIKWSEDDPYHLAFMEKSRLYTLKDKETEEPVQTDGYIFDFSDLQVRMVALDDLMKAPDANFVAEEFVSIHETKTLKETKDQLNQINLKDAYSYIKKNPHPKLWKYLAEKALDNLDFQMAETAFVEFSDYQSIQLCKRLQLIDDKNKQKAEILAFYGKYDEAEALYRKMERRDLAIQLRMKIGDWFRVVELVQEGYGNDDILNQAYDKIGDYYADRFKWKLAANFYKKCNNYERLAEMYYNLEEYDSLKGIIEALQEGNPLLMELGQKFQSVGLCDDAVDAYVKAGNVKTAVDCCVLLNQWAKAVELAEKNNFVQIEGLISMYATQLMEKKRKLEVVELYRKANRNTEAAKMLGQIATDLIKNNANPLLIKKLYVMAALEVDFYKKKVIEATLTGQGGTTAKTLDSLITSDINTSTDKILTNPWRGAEAWHFYLLAQRQLYAGNYRAALKTAIRATEYELELGTKQVYSLLATAAYYCKHWKECSRAFVKLENIENLSESEKEKYEGLAAKIFSKYAPKEPQAESYKCPGKGCDGMVTEYVTHCKQCGSNFQPCVITGRSILVKEYYSCKACKHKLIESEILSEKLSFCPLCHSAIDFKMMKQ